MACCPTCTMPITGTSIPANQSQPTVSHGMRSRCRKVKTVMAMTMSAQTIASTELIDVG